MTSGSSSSTIIKTSLIAGIAGAGLALLFAPRNGIQTREKLKDTTARFTKTAKHNADDFTETLQSNVHEIDSRLENMQEAMRARRSRREQSPVLTNWEEEV